MPSYAAEMVEGERVAILNKGEPIGCDANDYQECSPPAQQHVDLMCSEGRSHQSW